MQYKRPCVAYYDVWNKVWLPKTPPYVSEELLDIGVAIQKRIDRKHNDRMW